MLYSAGNAKFTGRRLWLLLESVCLDILQVPGAGEQRPAQRGATSLSYQRPTGPHGGVPLQPGRWPVAQGLCGRQRLSCHSICRLQQVRCSGARWVRLFSLSNDLNWKCRYVDVIQYDTDLIRWIGYLPWHNGSTLDLVVCQYPHKIQYFHVRLHSLIHFFSVTITLFVLPNGKIILMSSKQRVLQMR